VPHRWRTRARRITGVLAATLVLVTGSADVDPPVPASAGSMAGAIVPAPASVRPADGVLFPLTGETAIAVDTAALDVARIGGQLATWLREATGLTVPVRDGRGAPGDIALGLGGGADLGPEGYRLTVSASGVRLSAHEPAGLFRGVQSLRQLVPVRASAGRWRIPGGVITDQPRFTWRGASLDVARHFFAVEDVKRYIDALALYKINVLHLHLSDDQGWRIEIKGWPRLTSVGGATEVGGGEGGFFSQEQYADLVAYAQARYMTVVPEIDMPGHTNAALASYAELNCDGKAKDPYTSTGVGFSALCATKPGTYTFLDQVIGQLAALTPGRYLHIGGDEVDRLTPEQYRGFVEKVAAIAHRHGKTPIGWQEIAAAKLPPGSAVQYWKPDTPAAQFVEEVGTSGAAVVLSPADRAYLDMKYGLTTSLGLDWAGRIEVEDAYAWEPSELIPGLPADRLLGVEAPIWTETTETFDELTYLAFPRLPAIAELGWSPPATRNWEDFRRRLAVQGPRWEAMGLNFYRSSQVPWPR
jgi:hexosaminidase